MASFQRLLDSALWPTSARAKECSRRAENEVYQVTNNPFRWISRDIKPGSHSVEDNFKSSDDYQKDRPLKEAKTANATAGGDTVLSKILWPSTEQEVKALTFFDSDNFKKYLYSVCDHEIEAEMDHPDLTHLLKEWQATGYKQLLLMADVTFKGGLLCDETGLGKTLTVLRAALYLKKQNKCGFILVACLATCQRQWYEEIMKFFKHSRLKGNRPSTIILDHAKYSVEELLRWDIVITSHSFLRQRYNDIVEHETGLNIAHATSLRSAQEILPNFALNGIPRPLHNSVYGDIGKLPIVILDESHNVRNPDTVLAKSLRAIPAFAVFILSGTPVHNRWTDLYGQLSLLHGNPFRDLDHFQSMFTGQNDTHATRIGRHVVKENTTDHPEKPHMLLLTRLMAGIVVARPKEVMEPPDEENHDVPIDMSNSFHTLLISEAGIMARFHLRLSRYSRRSYRAHVLHAMQCFSKAQMIAASPLIWKANERMQRAQGDNELFAQMRGLINNFFDTAKLPRSTDINSLSTEQVNDLKKFVETNTRKRRSWNKTVAVPSEQERTTAQEGQATIEEEQNMAFGSDPKDFEAADDAAREEDMGICADTDFNYVEDSIDKTYDPSQGDNLPEQRSGHGYEGSSSESSERSGDEDVENPKKRASQQIGRSGKAWTKKWLKFLAEQDQETIMSPRVVKVVEQVQEISQATPK
ncbi:hypothetical protein F5883DRAFT_635540 [Diaporthe sp. PMI_573]|nr:hypothetical protein F5883DRAFT_635540 [Diaporthaceae sp. PMI_573]